MGFTPMRTNLRANLRASSSWSTRCSERPACIALCEPRAARLCPGKACTSESVCNSLRRINTHPCIALRLLRIHKRREERTQRIALRPNAPRQKVCRAFANSILCHRGDELMLHFPSCLLPCPAHHARPCWQTLNRVLHSLPSPALNLTRALCDGSTFMSQGTSMR